MFRNNDKPLDIPVNQILMKSKRPIWPEVYHFWIFPVGPFFRFCWGPKFLGLVNKIQWSESYAVESNAYAAARIGLGFFVPN